MSLRVWFTRAGNLYTICPMHSMPGDLHKCLCKACFAITCKGVSSESLNQQALPWAPGPVHLMSTLNAGCMDSGRSSGRSSGFCPLWIPLSVSLTCRGQGRTPLIPWFSNWASRVLGDESLEELGFRMRDFSLFQPRTFHSTSALHIKVAIKNISWMLTF